MTEFTVPTATFKKAVNKVYPVCQSKVIPILKFIKIVAKDNQLHLTGTDLQVRIETSLSSQNKQDGEIAFNAKKLALAVNKAKKDTITIKSDGKINTFTCGKFTLKSNALSLEDFPLEVQQENTSVLTINAEEINKAIDSVSYAVSDDKSRKLLTGVCFTSESDKLFIAATDSKRLAESYITVKSQSNDMNVVTSKDNMQYFKSLSGDITLSSNNNYIEIKDSDTRITFKILEGKYPNYRQIMVKPKPVININVKDMLSCIDNILVSESDTAEMIIKDNTISFEATNKNTKDNVKDEFECSYEKEEIKILVNPEFIKDIFSKCGNFAEMTYDKNSAPVRIDSENVSAVFMPMRNK